MHNTMFCISFALLSNQNMKKLHLLAVFAIITLAAACHNGRHTVIIGNTNGHYVKVEYSGDIYLTDDNQGIKNISPGGYVRYENNDESIVAERHHDGRLYYKLNGGDEQSSLNDEGKRLIALAVKDIIKHPHNER